jgi:hypothetical protein
MKKISVIFILPDLETGGAERIVTTIANHLSGIVLSLRFCFCANREVISVF